MRLLLQAVKIELAYYNVKGFETIAQQRRREWETRIRTVKSNFEQFDRTVRDRYHAQSRVDIKKYAAENYGMSHEVFSRGLYGMLNEKYYWRVWFVVVYNPIYGYEKHTVSVCGGHILFRQDGRNIVVASKDRNASAMDLQRARTNLNNAFYYTYGLGSFGMLYRGGFARRHYNRIDKTGACSVAVIRTDSNVSYRGDPNRIMHIIVSPHRIIAADLLHVIMFG
ncbi:unnamed protein product [Owenia fusiformis]|uniref:Uncharacterized protein n=1 Tax=Owenia fusiformis TaxID=6347 RepID=A0A8S4Q744_OWEFU|nr:unnamed protein product [Owenia fusiformis]